MKAARKASNMATHRIASLKQLICPHFRFTKAPQLWTITTLGRQARSFPPLAKFRLQSSQSWPASTVPTTNEASVKPSAQRQRQEPSYLLRFTCKPCLNTSTHTISKHGYHHGTVLITCPNCKQRHIMADHLKIFSDENITIEDIMKRKGTAVSRGTLDANGDVEWWD